MGTRKNRFDTCYAVGHPEHVTAYVVADSWEEATVKAAAFWGVPWGKVVFDCQLEKKLEARRGVCSKCRRIIYSNRELCENCEQEMRVQERMKQQRLKKSWYLGRKDGAFGT